MKKKNILSLADLSKEEAFEILELSLRMKNLKRKEIFNLCSGYSATLFFEKPSTRTRVSLEVAIAGIGGIPVVLTSEDSQLSRGEDIKDTARVLSKYTDVIVARVYDHQTLIELAEYSEVPVVNSLSDRFHPLQALADVMTIYEKSKDFKDLTVSYVGDGNNVCNSLILASSLFGFKLKCSTPKGYQPSEDVVEMANRISDEDGNYQWYEHPQEAVEGAEVIYTDTWISMGDEDEASIRLKAFEDWQVNKELLKNASPDVVCMHCLPAHKGHEITEEVFESKNCIVFEQAENRLHTARAVFYYLWKGGSDG